MSGGGCAREEEGGATCVCYPGALPHCGGEGDPTCERRRRDGGQAGGTTCSGTCGAPLPLAPGRRSPASGEGALCLRAPVPHVRGRGGALPVSCGARTGLLVRPWCAGVPVGPAQHCWCGPGVRGFPWGLHSTAGAALVCGGSCGACTALLVRPWRVGIPVGPAQHCWCGPGVWGSLWGPHSTAGAALVCGGSCGACTALLVRPWRVGVPVGPAPLCWCGPGVWGFLRGPLSTAGAALACGGSRGARSALLVRPWRVGVPVGPAQHCWCGPGVWGFLWGLLSTAEAALACGGSCGGLHSTAGAALACGGGLQERGSMPGTPAGGGGLIVVLTSRREVGSLAAPVMRKGREGTGREGRRVRRGGGGAWEGRVRA